MGFVNLKISYGEAASFFFINHLDILHPGIPLSSGMSFVLRLLLALI